MKAEDYRHVVSASGEPPLAENIILDGNVMPLRNDPKDRIRLRGEDICFLFEAGARFDRVEFGAASVREFTRRLKALQAQAALNAVLAAQPGAYQSKWQSQLDDIIGRILNREAFSYDFNEDALYKQYAEQYMRGGKLAMQDTMGQAAAMTGGYGNSYASTAGNQAYQEYLSQLNAVIPELYGMALDRYQMEGQEMYNQYGLLSDQEAQEYGRYQDSYNKWLAERDYATGVYNTEEDRDYSRYMDTVDIGYRTHTDAETREWEEFIAAADKATGAQKIALDSVYTAIENGVMPSDKDIAASGLDPHYVQELYNSYEDKATEAASEKTKAEAMDKINMYLATGMEIPKQLQKQAGLTDDDMAAIAAASTKSTSSSTSSKPMSPDDLDEWSDAVLDAETEEDAMRYLTELEKINSELADYLYEKWRREHGGDYIDTTVTNTTVKNNNPNLTGGGGGKIMVRY
jgi:hypothetical protein